MALTPGFQIPFGIQPLNPIPTDSWSGPYSGETSNAAVAAANASIPASARFQTMEVRLVVDGVAKKYWYKNGITDSDLIEFLDESKLPLAGGVLTGSLTGTNATFTSSVSAPILKGSFEGDGSNLTGVIKTQYTPPADATFTSSVSAPVLKGSFEGDGSNLTGVIKTQYTPPSDATFTSSVSAPAVRGMFYGNGSNITGLYDGTDLKNLSGSWDSTYSTVQANSGTWGTGGGGGGSISLPTSANWDSTYSTVQANSASWGAGTGVTGKYLPLSGGTVTGNLNITNSSLYADVGVFGMTLSSEAVYTKQIKGSTATWNGYGDPSNLGSVEIIPNTSLYSQGQYLKIRPTSNFDEQHIHIEAGTNGDLVLGNDDFYYKLNGHYLDNSTYYNRAEIGVPQKDSTAVVVTDIQQSTGAGSFTLSLNTYPWAADLSVGNEITVNGETLVISTLGLYGSNEIYINFYPPLANDIESGNEVTFNYKPRKVYTFDSSGNFKLPVSGVIVFQDGTTQNTAPNETTTPVFDIVTTGTVIVGETMKALDNHWGTTIAFYSNQVNNIVNADEYSNNTRISMQKYSSTNPSGDTIYLRVIIGTSPNAGDTTYTYGMDTYPLITVATVGDETAQILKTKCISAVNTSGHFIAVDDTGEVNSFRVYQNLPGVGYGLTKNLGMTWFDGMQSGPFNYNGSFVAAKKLIFPDGSIQTTAPSETTTPVFDSVTTDILFAGEAMTVLNNAWGTEIQFNSYSLNSLVNITDPYSTASYIQLNKYSSSNQNGTALMFRTRNGASSDVGDTTYTYGMDTYPLITVVTVGDETAQIFKTKCLSAINASGHFIAVDDTGEVNSFSVYQKESGVGENLTATVVNGMGYFDYGTTANFTKNRSFVVAKNLVSTVPLASLEDNSDTIASTAWVKAQNYLSSNTSQTSISTVNVQTWSLTSNDIISNNVAINDVASFKKDFPSAILTFDPNQINSLRQGGYYYYVRLEDETSVSRAVVFQSDYNSSSGQSNPIVVYSDPENETLQSLKTKSISSINASGFFTAEDYSPYEIKVSKKGFGGSLESYSSYQNSFYAVPSATNFVPFDVKNNIAQLSATVKSVPLDDNSANIASTSWVKSQNYIGGTEPIFSGLTITNTLTAGLSYPKATITFPAFELDQYGGDWRNQINATYYDLMLQGPSATYRLGWRTDVDNGIDICVTNDADADTYQDFITLTIAAINAHGVFTAEASPTNERRFYVYQKIKTATVYTAALYNSGYGSGFWTWIVGEAGSGYLGGSFSNFKVGYSIVPDPAATFNVPQYTPPANATFTSSVSAPALSGSFYGDGSGILNLQSHNVATSVVAETADFTLSNSHMNRIVKFDTTSAPLTALIPHNDNTAIQTGVQTVLIKTSGDANTIVIVPDTGVTLISKSGYRSITTQAAIATLIKLDTNEWILAGGISN